MCCVVRRRGGRKNSPSELAIRPLFRQLEHRAKAHILVAFLGYALWVTLKHLLYRRGTGVTPAKALAQLATLQSADIILPTTDGREIRLPRVATPTPEQQRLVDQLDITIPPTSSGTPNVVQTS